MLTLVLCAGQLKLATVGFTQVGLSDAQASFYAEHFSLQLASVDRQGVSVTTPKDMAAMLGIEKQKQMLGCADEASSCMAELAGALGADGFVTGQLAKVGQSLQLNVKILSADGTRALFLYSSKLLHSEEALIEELNDVAVSAVEALRAELAPGPEGSAAVGGQVSASGRARPRSALKLLPGVLGVLAFGVATVGYANAADKYSKLNDSERWATLGVDEAQSLVRGGKEALTAATILTVVGAVILVGTLLWYLLT